MVRRSLLLALAFALGGTASYQAGSYIVSAQEREGILKQADDALLVAIANYNDVLEKLGRRTTSSTQPCDTADLVLMREIVFESDVVIDLARTAQRTVVCTAVNGVCPAKVPIHPTDYLDSNGVSWGIDVPLVLYKDKRALILGRRGASAIINPAAFLNEGGTTDGQSVVLLDPSSGELIQVVGTQLPAPKSEIVAALRGSDGLFSYGDGKGVISCHTGSALCAVVSNSIGPGSRAPLKQHLGWILIGGILAASAFLVAAIAVNRHRSLQARARRAIRNDEICVHYQPIADLSSNVIVGCEALVRWFDRSGKLQPTEAFVSAAEKHGFVTELTDRVIEHVLRDFSAWLADHRHFHVSVNLSALDVLQEDFPERLARRAKAANVQPSQITLELTERITSDDEAVYSSLGALRERGFPIAIDDFGSGYSGLKYIQECDFDYLKADKFLADHAGTSLDGAMLSQVLEMARRYHVKVIVEGIEHEEQLCALGRAGADYGQGWAIARPMPAKECLAWLHDEERHLEGPAFGPSIPNPAKGTLRTRGSVSLCAQAV